MTGEEMLKEARRLAILQRAERGSQVVPSLTDPKKKTKAPGPYRATPENEGRAALILWLRRQAARKG